MHCTGKPLAAKILWNIEMKEDSMTSSRKGWNPNHPLFLAFAQPSIRAYLGRCRFSGLAQWVKGSSTARFSPWPGNFHMPWVP